MAYIPKSRKRNSFHKKNISQDASRPSSQRGTGVGLVIEEVKNPQHSLNPRSHFQSLKAVSTAHILVNMSNSSSQLKRGNPLHDGGINGVDEERPQALKNFVKAKQKINAIFANFIMCLEYFITILNGLSDKNDIKKDLSEVRLSNVAV